MGWILGGGGGERGRKEGGRGKGEEGGEGENEGGKREKGIGGGRGNLPLLLNSSARACPIPPLPHL